MTIDLTLVPFNDILAEVRRRYPVSIIAIQFYQEGGSKKLTTRIHHSNHSGDDIGKLGLAHAVVLELENRVRVCFNSIDDDHPMD